MYKWSSKIALATSIIAWGAAVQADDIVRIGVLSDMTGHAADTAGPGAVVAAELAAADFQNEVAGMKVEVLSADAQNKPDVGLSIATEWYDVQDVDVIVDMAISSIAFAVQNAATERKKTTLVTGAFSEAFYGDKCSPYNQHWAVDTHAMAQGTVHAVAESGSKSWFFLTYDFIFGELLQNTATKVIEAEGGSVSGAVRTPVEGTDYSSFLLQAQSSGAQVIGLTQVGTDLTNAVRQAAEFGIVAGGQKLAGFLVFLSDVHALGLEAAQGLTFTNNFYWDDNEETRAFAKRFMEKRGVMPTQTHAVTYAALVHYLHAVEATGSTDTVKTTAWMKANPAQFFGETVTVRADGRMMSAPGVYRVKSPADSKYDWDYLTRIGSISAEEAYFPMMEKCNFKY